MNKIVHLGNPHISYDNRRIEPVKPKRLFLIQRALVLAMAVFAAGVLFCAYAETVAYNDLGDMAGENNDYWNTTARADVRRSICVSSSTIPIDGYFRTQDESMPCSLTSFPYRGFVIILH